MQADWTDVPKRQTPKSRNNSIIEKIVKKKLSGTTEKKSIY